MWRFLMFAGLVLAPAVLVVALVTALFEPAILAYRQGIVGVALGARDDITRVPRRAMDCTRPDPAAPAESCTVTIDGTVLRVDVEYEEDRLRFHRCEASYGPTTASCWPVWFALTGGPPIFASVPIVRPGQPHETVQWLGIGRVETFNAPHLEISEEALQTLRQRYPLTNYYERDWMGLVRTASLVAACVTASLILLLSVWRPFGPSGLQRQFDPLRRLVLAASCGGVVFCLSFVGLFFQAMRAGLVD
jgi:hypothetical protein